jgi:hypothetical protein
MVSICTIFSEETLSGLYFVINCGIERLSSTDKGPYDPTIMFGEDMLKKKLGK